MWKAAFKEFEVIWSAYHFKFFKSCLPEILLGPFLNILTCITNDDDTYLVIRLIPFVSLVFFYTPWENMKAKGFLFFFEGGGGGYRKRPVTLNGSVWLIVTWNTLRVSYILFLSKIFFYNKIDLRFFYFHSITNQHRSPKEICCFVLIQYMSILTYLLTPRFNVRCSPCPEVANIFRPISSGV